MFTVVSFLSVNNSPGHRITWSLSGSECMLNLCNSLSLSHTHTIFISSRSILMLIDHHPNSFTKYKLTR